VHPSTTSSTYFSTTSSVVNSSQSSTSATSLAPVYSNKANILIHPSQVNNKILHYLKNAPYQVDSNILPDYVMGTEICGIFLSLKYHLLCPDYVQPRMKQVTNAFKCKILLCLVDIEESKKALKEITRLALACNFTVILAWSKQEAARYIETFKLYENKSPDIIKERAKDDHHGKITDTLTSVKSVNKTDVESLLANFGTVKVITSATMEELSLCPGLGERKIRRLYNAFHQVYSSLSSLQEGSKANLLLDSSSSSRSLSLSSKAFLW